MHRSSAHLTPATQLLPIFPGTLLSKGLAAPTGCACKAFSPISSALRLFPTPGIALRGAAAPSTHLQWIVLRSGSSFRSKRNKQAYSTEAHYQRPRNSFCYNGLIHRKTVALEPEAHGRGVVVVMRLRAGRRKAATSTVRTTIHKKASPTPGSIRHMIRKHKDRPDPHHTTQPEACDSELETGPPHQELLSTCPHLQTTNPFSEQQVSSKLAKALKEELLPFLKSSPIYHQDNLNCEACQDETNGAQN
uniref:uncharacterized protein LOC105757114 n=1 Tax=Odobenus rosmarus divergens TaxID=9708 RepID=UPI00063CE56E|nr:PREDICTED: uncharacterized protein LOC105757114 [Odobenus rosmarus divergens]